MPSIFKSENKIPTWLLFLMSFAIGTLCFLVLYGTTPLHASNDNWIMAAIDEDDIVQHYAGWTMFRAGNWTYPFGMISDMAKGTGTTLTYTDSIPLVAIIFKLLFEIIPYTGDFQYFGIFTLLCFVLQAFAAGLLVRRKTHCLSYVALAQLIFCFAPPLLDRTLRHTALGAQFIVLFSMWEYFKTKDENYSSFAKGYMILATLAVGIHPYFLPMVMIFSLLTMVEGCIETKKYSVWIGQFFSSCLAAGIVGILLGAFESSGDVERDGYGHYTMNLLAPINPQGGCDYTWSSILPILGQTNGNYEGFNYLGLGIIIASIVILIRQIITVSRRKCVFVEKRHLGYFIAMVFMTIFAISNVVTVGKNELFTVLLPKFITDLCGIFRSSGRMFYPVFYSLYLIVFYRIWDITKKKAYLPVIVAVLLTIVQLLDLSSAIKQKHERMANAAFYQSVIDDPTIEKMAQGCDYIVGTKKYRDVCVFAGLHNMATSFSASTGGTWDEAYAMRDRYIEDLENGKHDGKTMFVTESWTWANDWVEMNSDMEMYQYGENYFVAPKR